MHSHQTCSHLQKNKKKKHKPGNCDVFVPCTPDVSALTWSIPTQKGYIINIFSMQKAHKGWSLSRHTTIIMHFCAISSFFVQNFDNPGIENQSFPDNAYNELITIISRTIWCSWRTLCVEQHSSKQTFKATKGHPWCSLLAFPDLSKVTNWACWYSQEHVIKFHNHLNTWSSYSQELDQSKYGV